MASKVIHVQIFRTCEYVMSCGKKDFEDDDHITDLGMMSELSKGF